MNVEPATGKNHILIAGRRSDDDVVGILLVHQKWARACASTLRLVDDGGALPPSFNIHTQKTNSVHSLH